MDPNPYKDLAQRLDSIPNGFPPTDDGAELRLLEKLYTPREAAIVSQLRLTPESIEQISDRLNAAGIQIKDPKELMAGLKQMARNGLIAVERTSAGLAFGLLPFVVGIYEYQAGRIDSELAQLFEDYYNQAFGEALSAAPAFHRVVPVNETITHGIEIRPHENVLDVVNKAQAWGVMDCICRVQKKLIGDPCDHPIDVCMVMSQKPGAFNNTAFIQPLTRDQAFDVLARAAEAGLVHSVSNTRSGNSYICNCCTCSCGILRGLADLGIANAVASSPFINQVDDSLCISCETCVEHCQFDALELIEDKMQIIQSRCVGCGVCVQVCEEGAMALVRRPDDDILEIPESEIEWQKARAEFREIDLNNIL
jgi:Pyruvate/2-oxoacid:ferredoxin oxidoreductase delta subunit